MFSVPGKCDLVNRKKKWKCALIQKAAQVQEKKRSFEYNTRNTAAPLSCQGSQPPLEACNLAPATFPTSPPTAPDQIQVLQQNGPLTSQWKHLKLLCRLFPSDHPIVPDSILRNPCNSSTLSSNVMSFKFSLITSIKSEIYRCEKYYVNHNMQCKCWLLVY